MDEEDYNAIQDDDNFVEDDDNAGYIEDGRNSGDQVFSEDEYGEDMDAGKDQREALILNKTYWLTPSL